MAPTDRSRQSLIASRDVSAWDRLWSPFWALPVAIVTVTILVAVLLPNLESQSGVHLPSLFGGGPQSARSLLSSIATAMISVTGLVFSITMVVLQLASSQFSPRLLRGFLRDRVTQVTLGLFLASFVFALVILRAVRGGSSTEQDFVPQLSVTVAFLLVLASVGMFIAFIASITRTVQVSTVIAELGAHTGRLLDRALPADGDGQGGAVPTWSPDADDRHRTVLSTSGHGVVAAIDHEALIALARHHNVVIEVRAGVGSFVPTRAPLARVWSTRDLTEVTDRSDDVRNATATGDALDLAAAARAFRLDTYRELEQDPAFGVRQLVDIAERALSPGINDPTTAVESLNAIHEVLRLVATRPSLSPYLSDEDGTVRVIRRPLRFADLLDLGVDEIAHYGKDSLQVPRRLIAILDDLCEVALPEHRALVESKRRAMPTPEEPLSDVSAGVRAGDAGGSPSPA